MASTTNDTRWLPPALLTSFLVILIFSVWGNTWKGAFASIMLPVLSMAIGFIMHHWGHLPIIESSTFDESADRSQSKISEWAKRSTDIFVVLGTLAFGAIGFIFALNWHNDGPSIFKTVATWGDHGIAVMSSIVIGAVAAVAGIIWVRVSGDRAGQASQVTTVGIWTVFVASASPILTAVVLLAIIFGVIYFISGIMDL